MSQRNIDKNKRQETRTRDKRQEQSLKDVSKTESVYRQHIVRVCLVLGMNTFAKIGQAKKSLFSDDTYYVTAVLLRCVKVAVLSSYALLKSYVLLVGVGWQWWWCVRS